MKLNVKSLNKSVKAGFSLVELLIVIAIIGIMASIAIPIIGKMSDTTKIARAKRNAQNVASIYTAAYNAGAFDGVTLADTAAVLTQLDTGVLGKGSFANTQFKVPNIVAIEGEQTEAAKKPSNYLSFSAATNTLEYTGRDN